MTYNIDLTGQRLREARKNLGYSLEKVAEACGINQYQTVSKWENGNSIPSIDKLVKLSELYGCEIGYLLGEYDCKHRSSADVKATTGLSESAIENLKTLNFFSRNNIKALNKIIEFNQGDIISLISKYLFHQVEGNSEILIGDLSLNANNVADVLLLEISNELSSLRNTIQSNKRSETK